VKTVIKSLQLIGKIENNILELPLRNFGARKYEIERVSRIFPGAQKLFPVTYCIYLHTAEVTVGNIGHQASKPTKRERQGRE